MVFAYYHRLSVPQRRVYRRSDEVTVLRLPRAGALHPLVAQLPSALRADDRRHVEGVCQSLADEIVGRLRIAPVGIELLAARPANSWGELHGLYTPASTAERAWIQLWMRTARHKRVVAFRTFLRTLLHELCHHLDYELLALPDSFHTQGFYQRLSSLFHQLLPPEEDALFAERLRG